MVIVQHKIENREVTTIHLTNNKKIVPNERSI